jgi:predicted transcriptional regulator
MAGFKYNVSDNPQNIRVSAYITKDMADKLADKISSNSNISDYLRNLIQKDLDKQENN